MGTTKYTRNYDRFKHLEGNRAVMGLHVKRLMKSIEENGWIADNPVLVNQEFEIIDGQHRFEACKALALPIEYKVVYGEDLSTCIIRNNTAKRWSTTDFVKAKAAEGNESFKLLARYLEKYKKMPVSEVLAVVGMGNGVLDVDWSYTMHGEEVEYLEELEWYAETFASKRAFIHAMYLVLMYGGIDWGKMRKQMTKRGLPKPLGGKAAEIVPQLQETYNYGLGEQKRVYFADEIRKITKRTDLLAQKRRKLAAAKRRR